MNKSTRTWVGFLFLLLLVSHETITVASKIRASNNLRDVGNILSAAENVDEMLGSLDDSALETMFMEVSSKGKMSEAEVATEEVRLAHASIREGYSFENSPVLSDIEKLPTAPAEGMVLSPTQLQYHREAISSFMEKAFSHLSSVTKPKGECHRSAKVNWYESCSEESDCVSSRSNPCKGKCVCDDSGINECECKSASDVELADVFKNREIIDEAFRMKDFFKSAAFGFIDGFFSGMIHHIYEGFEDPKCHDHSYVASSADELLDAFADFWEHAKSVHTKLWTKKDRKELFHSFIKVLKQLTKMLSSAMTFVWECTGTRQLTILFGIILVFFGIQLAIMGTLLLPIIIKVASMLLGLYFSASYLKKAVKSLISNVGKKMNDECDNACKKALVKKSFGIVGALAEVVLLSGAGSFIKNLPKTHLLKVMPAIKGDLRILMAKTRLAKAGKPVRITGKTFKSKPSAVADARLKKAMGKNKGHSKNKEILHALDHGAHAGEKFAHSPVTNALGHHEGGSHEEGHAEKKHLSHANHGVKHETQHHRI